MTASLSLYKSAGSDDRGRSVHENCDAAIVPNETRTLFPNEKTNHALFHIATPLIHQITVNFFGLAEKRQSEWIPRAAHGYRTVERSDNHGASAIFCHVPGLN